MDPTTDQVQAPQSSTVLDQLKQRREAIAEDRAQHFDVPGYGGLLTVRMKPVSWDRLKQIGVAAEKDRDPRKELFAQANTIIAGTMELMVRSVAGEEPKPLVE